MGALHAMPRPELIETLAVQPNLQTERDLSASFVYVLSAPAERTPTAEHLNSSPLRPATLIDLTSDSAASVSSRLADTASYLRNNPGNLNPSSFGSHRERNRHACHSRLFLPR